VTKAGGFILRQRVVGVLAVTRAMGNHGLKTNTGQNQDQDRNQEQQLEGHPSGIVARPSCRSLQLEADDRFVVLASDGLTDVMCDQSIVETVCDGVHKMRAESIKRGRPVKHAASTLSKLLVRKALQRGANDNITAMVIIL
jgi:serine/threonine protein phosphatase PrpC